MHPGRRILKLLRTAVVVLSTLLFLAAMGMWGRSYFTKDDITYIAADSTASTFFSLVSASGYVSAHHYSLTSENATNPQGWNHRSESIAFRYFPSGTNIGFRFLSDSNAISAFGPMSYWIVYVPYWFIALLSLPIPLLALRRWRRDRRIPREGLCPVCGYDLRASPTRCPECGTAREASATPS